MVVVFLTGLLILSVCLAQSEKDSELGAKVLEKDMDKESLVVGQQRIAEKERMIRLSGLMKKSKALVNQYHTCKAVLEDNINECDVLAHKSDVESCKNRFIITNFSKFLKEFRKTSEVSDRGFSWCKPVVDRFARYGDRGVCTKIGQAHMTGDVSAIEVYFKGSNSAGLAFITGNRSYCNRTKDNITAADCRDSAIYTQAVVIKNDKSLCEEIKNDLTRGLCRIRLEDKATMADCREFLYDEIEDW